MKFLFFQILNGYFTPLLPRKMLKKAKKALKKTKRGILSRVQFLMVHYAAKNLHALINLRQVFLFVIIRLFYRILQEISIKNNTKFRKNCMTIKSPFFLKKVRKKLLIIKNIFCKQYF